MNHFNIDDAVFVVTLFVVIALFHIHIKKNEIEQYQWI